MMNNIIEDEEKWLYADDNENSEEVPSTSKRISLEKSLEVSQPISNEDQGPEFESGKENFEEDSDDDGIIVSIGNIDNKPTTTCLLVAKGEKPQAPPQLGKLLVPDLAQPGSVNGTPVAEFNIDDVEEKRWRKPGADISDYFNYGFIEDTWTAYCERQRRMKLDESGSGHLQRITSHCDVPMMNGHSNVPMGGFPVINTVGPESHGSFILPCMSIPPPMLNQKQFVPDHGYNPSPILSISRSSDSNASSIKSLQEDERNFRKYDSKERDLDKKRERSRERHNNRYERGEKSRSRSRALMSDSQSSRDRYYNPPNSRSSGSTRSKFNMKTTKFLQEENRDFNRNDSKKRDFDKRRERSRERNNNRYERREKSRGYRSRSRNSRDRNFGSRQSRRGYY